MKLKDIGITPLIEMTAGGSTSAGSIAGVASRFLRQHQMVQFEEQRRRKRRMNLLLAMLVHL